MSALYGQAVSWRRRWYAEDPQRRRALARPVISVGNLSVGGAGKTPIAAHLARLLVAQGERPSILTRGYARRDRADGVTTVSDDRAILEGLARAGDEPLMLARALPGVPVLVCASRYTAGLLAERRFGVTAHVLDDGFQHVALQRTVDLVLVDEDDLADRPIPAGRLREPLANASAADALLVAAADPSAAERVGRALGVPTVFHVTRALGAPRGISSDRPVAVQRGARVFAIAGIARPQRFFSDVMAAGWQLAGSLSFRDHHPYGPHDIARIREAARSAGATVVLTTEKDAVRLEACDLQGMAVACVPLAVDVQPAAAFRRWLIGGL